MQGETRDTAPGSPEAGSPQHRLGHVALRVQDMERAKAFYLGLGLRLTWKAEDWAYLQSPETGDGVALLSPAYKAAGPHFAFHFKCRSEVDAIHAQLSAKGHSVGPVHDHRDVTWHPLARQQLATRRVLGASRLTAPERDTLELHRNIRHQRLHGGRMGLELGRAGVELRGQNGHGDRSVNIAMPPSIRTAVR
mgnify:CR=1 FL=1